MAKWFAMMCLCLTAVACGGSSDPEPVVCGPGNCTGCCFNNACQTGSTVAACGTGGAACSACGSHQVCLPALACGLDPAQEWTLLVESAVVKPTNNGAAWDSNGTPPDTLVRFENDPTLDTSIQVDTFTPTWSPAEGLFASAAVLTGVGIDLQLLDDDGLLSPDPITSLLTLTLDDADFAAGSITIGPVDGAESITFAIAKRTP